MYKSPMNPNDNRINMPDDNDDDVYPAIVSALSVIVALGLEEGLIPEAPPHITIPRSIDIQSPSYKMVW